VQEWGDGRVGSSVRALDPCGGDGLLLVGVEVHEGRSQSCCDSLEADSDQTKNCLEKLTSLEATRTLFSECVVVLRALEQFVFVNTVRIDIYIKAMQLLLSARHSTWNWDSRGDSRQSTFYLFLWLLKFESDTSYLVLNRAEF
jgi:hypothetical protein